MENIRNIDYNRYHSFFLEYYKDAEYFEQHVVRPCTATYEELTDERSKHLVYSLEGAIFTAEREKTLSEMLIECALNGVTIDFVEILIRDPEDNDRWPRHKCIKVIDMHKDDPSEYFEKINAPRYYLARKRKSPKNDTLKFLVVDTQLQEIDIDFLRGDYDPKAVIAGFSTMEEARNHLKRLNENK